MTIDKKGHCFSLLLLCLTYRKQFAVHRKTNKYHSKNIMDFYKQETIYFKL